MHIRTLKNKPADNWVLSTPNTPQNNIYYIWFSILNHMIRFKPKDYFNFLSIF